MGLLASFSQRGSSRAQYILPPDDVSFSLSVFFWSSRLVATGSTGPSIMHKIPSINQGSYGSRSREESQSFGIPVSLPTPILTQYSETGVQHSSPAHITTHVHKETLHGRPREDNQPIRDICASPDDLRGVFGPEEATRAQYSHAQRHIRLQE